MSDDMSGAAPVAMAPQVQTSRWAIISALAGVSCLPGGGIVSLITGVFALRQIAATQYIGGSGLAKFGILCGVFNLLSWGVAGMHIMEIREGSDAPIQAFLAGWSKSEADGENAAPGLKGPMHRGRSAEIQKDIADRMGVFESAERTDFGYRISTKGMPKEIITATYDVHYKSGAPFTARFDLERVDGQVQIVGYHLESPVLRDLAREGALDLSGEAAESLGNFGDGESFKSDKQMKSFHK
jgi:hypothetical protein